MKQIFINDGYILTIGESKYDNWDILNKSSRNNMFFHLSSFSSCYGILNNTTDSVHMSIIKQCAFHVKENSKYRNMRNIRVDYTECFNVKKGEFVGEAVYIRNKLVRNIVI